MNIYELCTQFKKKEQKRKFIQYLKILWLNN